MVGGTLREESPEFAFVCACAALRDRPGVDARPAPSLEGARIAAIAHRHQVVPLVIAAMRRSGARVPAPLAACHDPVAPLRLAREAVRLDALLVAEGIDPVFLKGSALAVLAYGDIRLRQSGDIDLLVRPQEAGRAAWVLAEAGYRMPGDRRDPLDERIARLIPIAKDAVLLHRDEGHVVELHWRTSDDPGERPIRDREAVQRVAITPGASVPTLGTEAMFAYLCAHGAGHCWARLRWLADVAALIAREADGGDRLWRGAVARGHAVAAASGILLAERFLDAPRPPAFTSPASFRLALLLTVSRRAIEAGGGTTDLARSRWRGWAEMTGKLLIASDAGLLRGWVMRLLYSGVDADAIGTSRLAFVVHPLLRIPRLIARRSRRRRP